MKILIPVDGSDHGNAVLDFVASRSVSIGESPDVQSVNVQPMISARVERVFGRD